VLNRPLETAAYTEEVKYYFECPGSALIKDSATAPDEPASAVIDAGPILLCSFEQIFDFPRMYLYRALAQAIIL